MLRAAFQPMQEFLKLVWERGLQFEQFTCCWMRKLQLFRVKEVAPQLQPFGFGFPSRGPRSCRPQCLVCLLTGCSVKRIAHHRVAQRSHVHADLVRPPSLDAHSHKRKFSEPAIDTLDDLVVGNSLTAI